MHRSFSGSLCCPKTFSWFCLYDVTCQYKQLSNTNRNAAVVVLLLMMYCAVCTDITFWDSAETSAAFWLSIFQTLACWDWTFFFFLSLGFMSIDSIVVSPPCWVYPSQAHWGSVTLIFIVWAQYRTDWTMSLHAAKKKAKKNFRIIAFLLHLIFLHAYDV